MFPLNQSKLQTSRWKKVWIRNVSINGARANKLGLRDVSNAADNNNITPATITTAPTTTGSTCTGERQQKQQSHESHVCHVSTHSTKLFSSANMHISYLLNQAKTTSRERANFDANHGKLIQICFHKLFSENLHNVIQKKFMEAHLWSSNVVVTRISSTQVCTTAQQSREKQINDSVLTFAWCSSHDFDVAISVYQ